MKSGELKKFEGYSEEEEIAEARAWGFNSVDEFIEMLDETYRDSLEDE